ncbi:MAG: esterase [Cytophagales bacterium]|nr:esterase [Armatimonadota bacterium]
MIASSALLLLGTLFPSIGAFAQERPAPILSPQVDADRRVTFRLRAPAARSVTVVGEWDSKSYPLVKDEATGVWSVTLGPVAPDLYGYSFRVDGLFLLDSANRRIKPMRSPTTSVLDMPGTKPTPCDPLPGIARGVVHLHDYESKPLGRRRLRVYTPAVYEKERNARFPVLYLFHGSGDNEATWTEFGRANVILDNLIASGAVKPMVVVMTDGHAVGSGEPEGRARNVIAFEQDLLEAVLPLAESHYRIEADRDHRAIAGLSMGGNQSLLVGLNHRDRFAWIGGMSSAIRDTAPLDPFFARREQDDKRSPIRLLWFAIGKDDFLLAQNRAFDALLTEKKVPHEYVETEGGHSWPVWRRYLAVLAPRLFTASRPAVSAR